MVSRGRHPKKVINAALDELDLALFAVEEVHRGHRWGLVRHRASGDTIAIWSTPRVPEDNADAIRRFARRHIEREESP
ncbi:MULTISPECIES: hypothetical protein [Nocardia]|uniref:hypothetical protein n=1 Tax=Nocardia TaxID=1817 RepID=UPI001E33C7D5|nr:MULTISPECIES: hypothetical protein [Nocardia]UGT58284.1 hypothetical protein LTT85_16205 [Nocardia asteroides]